MSESSGPCDNSNIGNVLNLESGFSGAGYTDSSPQVLATLAKQGSHPQ